MLPLVIGQVPCLSPLLCVRLRPPLCVSLPSYNTMEPNNALTARRGMSRVRYLCYRPLALQLVLIIAQLRELINGPSSAVRVD